MYSNCQTGINGETGINCQTDLNCQTGINCHTDMESYALPSDNMLSILCKYFINLKDELKPRDVFTMLMGVSYKWASYVCYYCVLI